MLKSILISIILTSITVAGNTQSNNYQQLIDSSIGNTGFFIDKKPIKELRLDLRDTTFYRETLSHFSTCTLNSSTLCQLISNSAKPDTTDWNDKELPLNIIAINSDSEFIYLKNVRAKLNLTTKKQIRHYRKILNQFNSPSLYDREISYLSRPVFDSTKTFSIVAFDNIEGILGGGGGIILFHFENAAWKQAGLLNIWKH